LRSISLMLGVALLCGLPTHAMAASPPGTRLVSCHGQSCLLVSGYRADPASAILINGHAVPVTGRRKWSARLPLDALRQWAPPYARSIDIAVMDAQAGGMTTSAALPIGLLGHTTDLAALVVRSR